MVGNKQLGIRLQASRGERRKRPVKLSDTCYHREKEGKGKEMWRTACKPERTASVWKPGTEQKVVQHRGGARDPRQE